jgi:hypothetical protein
MTPEILDRQMKAPKYVVPMLRDRKRPTNRLYTPKRREGALPNNVVVIPDTTISMYNVERNSNVSDLYSVGSQEGERLVKTSLPFVYGVELGGPNGEIIRF